VARERYDAVVVGAGHNGLVAASYLAKGGLRTLVLERRSRAGGLLTTEEIAPGVRAPVAADGVGGLRDDVVRDLGLGSHGFRAIEPEVVAFAPSADGPGLTLWRDPVRTAIELRTGTQPRDAEAFVAFDRRVRSLGAFLARVQATEPPDLASPSLADATGGLTLLNGLRHLGRQQLREALRVLPMSVADFVDEAVENEALRGVLGARGVRYAAMGPRSAGTALNLLWDSAAGGGAAGRTVFARGGPDSLAEALVAAARSKGATIRRDADVAAIRTGRGSVEGVALASGEEIDAGIVASRYGCSEIRPYFESSNARSRSSRLGATTIRPCRRSPSTPPIAGRPSRTKVTFATTPGVRMCSTRQPRVGPISAGSTRPRRVCLGSAFDTTIRASISSPLARATPSTEPRLVRMAATSASQRIVAALLRAAATSASARESGPPRAKTARPAAPPPEAESHRRLSAVPADRGPMAA